VETYLCLVSQSLQQQTNSLDLLIANPDRAFKLQIFTATNI
jgi:hypothetical protein